MQAKLGRSPPSPLSTEASACSRPSARLLQPTGRHGWTLPVMRSRFPNAADNCLAALEEGGGPSLACARPWPQATCWWLKGGLHAPRGAPPMTAPACCQHRGPCYAHKVGHMPEPWLAAVPGEAALTQAPQAKKQAMQIALRRRLRLPLPRCPNRCGPDPGRGQSVDQHGDHAPACPRTGLLARRAKTIERAWARVAREAVGPDGQVVPQQWLSHTTAAGVLADDRRRLDLVVCWAMCCDATLVSPLTRTGHPQPGAADIDGAVLRTAERCKPSAYIRS